MRSPRPTGGLKVGKAERREREIAAERPSRRRARKRVHRDVAAGRADPVDERLAEHARLDDRQLGLEDDALGAHVGARVLAEADDAAGRRGEGMSAYALEVRRCRD